MAVKARGMEGLTGHCKTVWACGLGIGGKQGGHVFAKPHIQKPRLIGNLSSWSTWETLLLYEVLHKRGAKSVGESSRHLKDQ